jgi:uncharacterized membrane protein YphA (DoxX/SURF4 family)
MNLNANKDFKKFDALLINWMSRHSIRLLRTLLGIIFLWFGLLKFIPEASPAQTLATQTIAVLSFNLLTPNVSMILLALLETLIGLGLVLGVYLRATLLLLFIQMLGTLTPLFLFPAETYVQPPFTPTLEGQYIIKNLVLIASGLVIGSSLKAPHTQQ